MKRLVANVQDDRRRAIAKLGVASTAGRTRQETIATFVLPGSTVIHRLVADVSPALVPQWTAISPNPAASCSRRRRRRRQFISNGRVRVLWVTAVNDVNGAITDSTVNRQRASPVSRVIATSSEVSAAMNVTN